VPGTTTVPGAGGMTVWPQPGAPITGPVYTGAPYPPPQPPPPCLPQNEKHLWSSPQPWCDGAHVGAHGCSHG
jgi:hypothetical protein